jgi:filamentous hemagglutinin family protein
MPGHTRHPTHRVNSPARLARLSALALAIKLACGSTLAAELPTAGTVTAGSGNISQSGNSLTVLQNTAKLGIEWETFNVGAEGRVTFVQPDANSIALNRVLGSDPSRILGALDANGKVFLLNPHGVIFGKNAQVNTGGLLASTLDLSDADFIAGNYTLRNNGRAASILNEGSLTAGSVVLVAP